MHLVGLIAEYNPFHLGHAYQLEAIKQAIPDATILVLLSGNIVQRGEFASLDKWQRSKLALSAGADLVLELPTIVSLQAADYFADSGVNLLAKLGVTTLAFGTETRAITELQDYVAWRIQYEADIDKALKIRLKEGYAYPAALTSAMLSLKDDWSFDVAGPNNMLAVQYLLANAKLAKPLSVLALPRAQSWQGHSLQSGSQVRRAWRSGMIESLALPSLTRKILRKHPLIDWEAYWSLLHYQLTILNHESLGRIFGVEEGLEYKLKKENQSAPSFADFIASLTSKRWTQARIQRVLMAILLGLDQKQAQVEKDRLSQHVNLRILGASLKGRQALKTIKQNQGISCFSRFERGLNDAYGLNLKADQVMRFNKQVPISEQNFNRLPILFEDRAEIFD